MRVVIVPMRAIRCGPTIRLFSVTGTKSTKHDIQHKRECGDENARSSPVMQIRIHVFGCYNPLRGRIFPIDRLMDGPCIISLPIWQSSTLRSSASDISTVEARLPGPFPFLDNLVKNDCKIKERAI